MRTVAGQPETMVFASGPGIVRAALDMRPGQCPGLCRIRWLAYSGPDDPHSIRTRPSVRPQPDRTGVFTDRLLPVSLLPRDSGAGLYRWTV